MKLSELRFNGTRHGRPYHLKLNHSGAEGITAVIYSLYSDGSVYSAVEQEFPNARTWEGDQPAMIRAIMRRHI